MLKFLLLATFITIAGSAPKDLDYTLVNKFALKLLANTYAYQESLGVQNVAISPVSIWSIFALMAEGSAGGTYEELVTTLNLPNDSRATQTLHSAIRRILQKQGRTGKDVSLKGQQAIFTDRTLEIHKEFCDSAMAYNTDIYSVDPRNTTKLAHDINLYVCLATEGRILNAIEPNFLEDLRMIIVDALYFKASWTHPFDQTKTREEPFYNAQGKRIGTVNMMYHKAAHGFLDSEQIEAQILELTYGKHEEFSMIILLPFDGTPMKRLLDNLMNRDMEWLKDLLADKNEVDVFIPRFKLSCKTDLINPLKYSGIYTIFDPVSAQLPGISDSPLYVSKAVQKVEIDVNEEGTEAAAATVIGVEDRILVPPFRANKEFVFLIIERRSRAILFSGVYTEPSLV